MLVLLILTAYGLALHYSFKSEFQDDISTVLTWYRD